MEELEKISAEELNNVAGGATAQQFWQCVAAKRAAGDSSAQSKCMAEMNAYYDGGCVERMKKYGSDLSVCLRFS